MSEERTQPLLFRPTMTDISTLEDFLLCIAASIEDSLIQAGAEPGTDYKILDLYKLANPYALSGFKDDRLSYVREWGGKP